MKINAIVTKASMNTAPAYKAAVDIFAKNMLLTLLFQDKLSHVICFFSVALLHLGTLPLYTSIVLPLGGILFAGYGLENVTGACIDIAVISK